MIRTLFILILSIIFIIIRKFATVPYCLDIDEAFSLYFSQVNVGLLSKVFRTENNPPLWELVLKVCFKLVTPTIENARLVSNLFFFLTIIPLYKIGESFLSKRIGLLSVLVFLLSNFMYYISNYARVYSLTIFISTVSVYFFLRFISDGKKPSLIALALVNALLLYSHYMTLSLVILESLGLLWIFSKNQRSKVLLIYFTILGILICPQIEKMVSRFMSSGISGTWVQPVTGFSDLYHMICKVFNLPINAIFFILVFVVFIVLVSKQKIKFCKELRWIAFFWISIWTVVFIYSFRVGLFFDKYLAFTFPLIFITLAYMLDSISIFFFKKGLVLPIIFLIIMVFTTKLDASLFTYHGKKYNYKALSDFIHLVKKTKGTRIFIQGFVHEKPVMYYYDTKIFFNNHQIENLPLVFESFKWNEIYFVETMDKMVLGNSDVAVSAYPLFIDNVEYREIGGFYVYFNHKIKG